MHPEQRSTSASPPLNGNAPLLLLNSSSAGLALALRGPDGVRAIPLARERKASLAPGAVALFLPRWAALGEMLIASAGWAGPSRLSNPISASPLTPSPVLPQRAPLRVPPLDPATSVLVYFGSPRSGRWLLGGTSAEGALSATPDRPLQLLIRNLSARPLPFLVEGHSLWVIDGDEGHPAQGPLLALWLPVRAERRVLLYPRHGRWRLGALSRPEGDQGLAGSLTVNSE